MIPTLLLAGFVFGKWWRISIPAAAIGWAVLLLAQGALQGVDLDLAHFLVPMWYGLINVLVGVLAFQAGRLVSTL